MVNSKLSENRVDVIKKGNTRKGNSKLTRKNFKNLYPTFTKYLYKVKDDFRGYGMGIGYTHFFYNNILR
jgi:hypothetical protein